MLSMGSGTETWRWEEMPYPWTGYDALFIHEDGIELSMNDGSRRKFLFADAVKRLTAFPLTNFDDSFTLKDGEWVRNTTAAPPTSP